MLIDGYIMNLEYITFYNSDNTIRSYSIGGDFYSFSAHYNGEK